VLFISHIDPFTAETGPAYHVKGLSKALCGLGCEVYIYVLEPKKGDRVINGIHVHYQHRNVNPFTDIPFVQSYLRFLASLGEINSLCRKYAINIVHGQCPSSYLYGLLRRDVLPFVVTLHATSFGELVSYFGMPISCINKNVVLNALGELWESFPALIKYKRVDKVIAVSRSIAEEAVRFYNLPREKVVAIHNGIDLSFFANLRPKKEIEEHMVLSVGRLIWRKGYKYLIDAMPHVLSEYPNAKLVIVGYGEQEVPLQRRVKKLGIDDSVIFLGNVSREKLYSLYQAAEVYVQPSLYEPFGITILEAMSMRKPVIATCVGGIPEIIKNGVDGLLVEPKNSLELADAIMRVFSDSALRSRLGSNARKRVERDFTWETVAKKTLKLYTDLLNGR
jgi:1,4-alpha-glucan branching enzyme